MVYIQNFKLKVFEAKTLQCVTSLYEINSPFV